MTTRLRIKPIVPRRGLFNLSAIASLRTSFFREQALKVVEELNKPIDAVWDIDIRDDGFTVSTVTPKYVYVNDGTRVRYATMSQNFTPQTRPNSLSRGPKRGGVLYISTKNPRPGIQARDFTGTLARTLPQNLSFEFGRFLARRVIVRN